MEGEKRDKAERTSFAPSNKPPSMSYYERVLAEVRNSTAHKQGVNSSLRKADKPASTIQSKIDEARVRARELDNEKKHTENELINKNQTLKKLTLILLFILLFVESIALFVLTFFQGFEFYGFDLDPITLRIIVVASLVQISAMLMIAVQHLFPPKK
jgi:hypothetical protein